MFFAQGMKWPGAVRYFDSVLPEPESQAGIRGLDLIEGIRQTILWADGRPLRCMHHGMSHGRMHAVYGLAVIPYDIYYVEGLEVIPTWAKYLLAVGNFSYWMALLLFPI